MSDTATYLKTVVAQTDKDPDGSIELAIYFDEVSNAYFAIDPSFTEQGVTAVCSPYNGTVLEIK